VQRGTKVAAEREDHGVAVPGCLAHQGFRRIVVALIVAILLSVAGAVAPCQIHCATHDPRHAGHGADRTLQHDDNRISLGHHLAHAGPCHLVVVPAAVTTEQRLVDAAVADAVQPGGPVAYVSIVWPPPEPRPRG
jgi:hypothetical protein